jgi:hypothetical protein
MSRSLIVPQVVEPWCHNSAGKIKRGSKQSQQRKWKMQSFKQSRKELQNQQQVGTNKKQQVSSNIKTTNTTKGRLSGRSKDRLKNPL